MGSVVEWESQYNQFYDMFDYIHGEAVGYVIWARLDVWVSLNFHSFPIHILSILNDFGEDILLEYFDFTMDKSS